MRVNAAEIFLSQSKGRWEGGRGGREFGTLNCVILLITYCGDDGERVEETPAERPLLVIRETLSLPSYSHFGKYTVKKG